MATEVEHTGMSTLLYAYAYLFANWFIFVFRIVVMSIIGCSEPHCWSSELVNRWNNRNNCKDFINVPVSAITHHHTQIYICIYIYKCVY